MSTNKGPSSSETKQPTEEEKDHLLPLFPTNGPGEKTVSCWNCLAILKVKDEWNVIECPNCLKINRIPQTDSNQSSGDVKVTLTTAQNNFDVKVPYIFGIITCPFCQTENRFRRDAANIICYKCHHSFSAESKMDFQTNSYIKPAISSLYDNNDLALSQNYGERRVSQTPNVRFSDYFYPDIMSYRGYYPQPYVYLPRTCGCGQTNELLRDLIDEVKETNLRKSRRNRYVYNPGQSRISSLRQFVNDMDYIDNRRRFIHNYDFDDMNSRYYGGEQDSFIENLHNGFGDNNLSEKGNNVKRLYMNDQNYIWGNSGTKQSSYRSQSFNKNMYL